MIRIIRSWNRLRIAFLISSYGRIGGREIETVTLASEINKQGKVATVDVFYSGPELPSNLVSMLGLHSKKFPTSITQFSQTLRILYLLFTYQYIVNMGCEPFLSFFVALIHRKRVCFYLNSPLEVDWAEKVTGIDYRVLSPTFVQTIHTLYGGLGVKIIKSDFMYSLAKFFMSVMEELSFRLCGKIFSASGFSAKQLEQRYSFMSGIVKVLYYPLRPDLLSLSDSKVDNDVGGYILGVGALVPEKRFDLLIDAVGYLRNLRDVCPKVVLAGKGPERDNLMQLAKKRGVDLKITYAGDPETLANLYRSCLFVVQTSYYESLSMIPLEAAIFGKASIICDRRFTGCSEVLDGGTAMYLSEVSPESVAHALHFLLQNPHERLRIGSSAKEKVLHVFSPSVTIPEFLRELQ